MARFEYVALAKDGRRQSGMIDSPSKELALAKLRDEGFMPLAVEPLKEAAKLEDVWRRIRPVPAATLVYFSRQLATMVDSGMSPLRALATLEEQEENPKFRECLTDVIANVESGQPMADAMAAHPEIFDRLYISMVRAGEASGNLHGTLNEIASQLEKQARLRKAIKGAMTYPKVVMGMAFVIVSGLLMFLVPRFANMFETIAKNAPREPGAPPPDTSLPGLTQAVVTISQLLYPAGNKDLMWLLNVAGRFAVIIIMVVFVIPAIIRRLMRNDNIRRRWDSFKLRAPMRIGPLVQKVIVARFARTFASLLRSGVPAQESLTIVAETSGNILVAEAVLEARDRMMAGSTISEPLAQSGVFPNIVARMIEVGEESGRLSDMLVKIAEFYEEDVDEAIKGLSSLIEPLMIVALGGIVGVIIIAIYLPILTVQSKISGGYIFFPGMFYLLRRGKIFPSRW